MMTAAFPPGKLDWMVWFALVPLLMSIHQESPTQAFRLGFLAGLSHFFTLVYWTIVALNNYGGLGFVVSFSVLVLFCVYLSLYAAVFAYVTSYMKESRFRGFTMASLWVALEYIRAKVLTGFPWCLLGYTQFRHPVLIQISDLIGVYGLSFLIVLSNAFIYFLLFETPSQKRQRLLREIAVVVLMALFTVTYGYYRLAGDRTQRQGQGPQSIRVAVVQGNIDQSIKWNPAYQEKTLDIYHRLTRSTSVFKPHLVVWPETAVPFFFQRNVKFATRVLEIIRESGADLIFGSPGYRTEGGLTKYYNRAYGLSPDGDLHGYYDKVHLVPFGEYVPLKRFLPFVGRLVQAAGDFASGRKIEPLELPSLTAGTLICFEVIFPELARVQVQRGADILVNLTNDAWFGMTSAPYQHLGMAAFRAVENRRPMVRAANTGISALIDPHGKIITQAGLFREEVLKCELVLADSTLTIYTRYGDLFPIALLAITLVRILYILCYNRVDRR